MGCVAILEGVVGVMGEYKDARFVLSGRAPALLCSQNTYALSSGF